MPEISKEYTLLKQNIDIRFLEKKLFEFESKNKDLYIEIHHQISEEIINDYIKFCIEAENNTLGLLRLGEVSKISVENIRQQYNLRTEDKFYFDVLIFNEDRKIIGKLNSWGYKKGGPYHIFHMYVKETHRGRGLGKLLLFKTIKIALDNIPELSKFDLQTHESNVPAQKTICQIGFVLK